jgi:hypothetical protein
MMIGRTDKAEIAFEGKRQQVIFNLAQPITFVSSSQVPGIQVADVFATSLAFSLRRSNEKIAQSWLELLEGCISEFSVFPDVERVDLESQRGFVNRALLHELVQRSQRRQNLCAGIPRFIAQATFAWRSH